MAKINPKDYAYLQLEYPIKAVIKRGVSKKALNTLVNFFEDLHKKITNESYQIENN